MGKTRTAPGNTIKADAPGAGGAEQQFLRLMSHEMRTPLNGVIGMLGLLSRTRLDGAQRAYLDAARSSALIVLPGAVLVLPMLTIPQPGR